LLLELKSLFIEYNMFPFSLVFFAAFIYIGYKYWKARMVVRQIVPVDHVKNRIESGEKLIVYIIDPLKCSPCITQFPSVRNILKKHSLPFVLVNYRDDEQYVKNLAGWKRVPALLAFQDGNPIKILDASNVFRISMDQYENFAQEVNDIWKISL
jgi:hypothetical protein